MTTVPDTVNETLRFQVNFARRAKGRKELRRGRGSGWGSDSADAKVGRTPRIARLMALALQFQEITESGGDIDYAELARQGCVTRARMTQVMGLLTLAPDIQEAILDLPGVTGRDLVTERDLRPVVAALDWREQRILCQHIGLVLDSPADRDPVPA